jgi:hypothetical protein
MLWLGGSHFITRPDELTEISNPPSVTRQPPPSPVCFLKMPPSWHHLHAYTSADTRRREEVADDGTEKSALSLGYLLWLPPTRRTILDNISAFEVAKLVHLKLCVLTPKERERYLKPLRCKRLKP